MSSIPDPNPPWWRDAVFYQIYPRSFMDSDGDGLGDLPGLLSRLDYLAGLGVDALWLSPIYPSPDVDYGYDVSDYLAVDPRFGSLQDLDRLLAEAHRRGLRVILDFVINHTSDQHPWFQESRSSRENPRRDWYIWRDPKPGGRPPNNWQSIVGGRGWIYDPPTGQYYYRSYFPEQPDLNWRNPQVHAAMLEAMRFWLERGVDGFRLDVFSLCFKDALFRDNPPKLGRRPFEWQRPVYSCDQPEMFPLLRDIRALLDSYPERYAVGEPYLPSLEKSARYGGPDRLHAVFNFDLLSCPWRPGCFLRAAQQSERWFGAENWPTWVLSNHDAPRAASPYGRGEQDERLKVALAVLLTLRSTPFLYYGDEIGLRDAPLRRDQILDPVGRRYWPFYKGRDGARAPMPWDAGANGGFTSGRPWLPLHPDAPLRNVAAQEAHPGSLLWFTRRLLAIRRETEALRRGLFQPVTFEPRAVLAYLRQSGEQCVLAAFNFDRRPRKLLLGGELARRSWRLLLSNRRDALDRSSFSSLTLQAEEACLLEQV